METGSNAYARPSAGGYQQQPPAQQGYHQQQGGYQQPPANPSFNPNNLAAAPMMQPHAYTPSDYDSYAKDTKVPNLNSSVGTIFSPALDGTITKVLGLVGLAVNDSDLTTGNNQANSQSQTMKLVGVYAATLLIVLLLFSGRDFSVLMTFGSLTRAFGFVILLSLIFTGRSAKGISLKSLQLYSATFVFRLFSILRHEGYLPYDKTGDWLYHLLELLSLACAAAGVYLVAVPLKSTYDSKSDAFGSFGIPPEFGALYLFLPALVLAILVHPNLNGDFLSDVCWTASMYLESISVVPQLYFFQRNKGKIEMLTAHFVVALGVARVMDGIFWAYSYKELKDTNAGSLPGYLAMFSQLVHVIVLGDFFYYYALAVKKGTGTMALPSTNMDNV